MIRLVEHAFFTWNVAVMMAWEATMAARMAMISEGITQPGGTALKKGF